MQKIAGCYGVDGTFGVKIVKELSNSVEELKALPQFQLASGLGKPNILQIVINTPDAATKMETLNN